MWVTSTTTSFRRTASYSIDRAEFADAKATQAYAQLHTRKEMMYVRGENGTYTSMLDTGIAICGISCVQFITG
jgi:hypothetical protein